MKVSLFEDHEQLASLVARWLLNAGHQVRSGRNVAQGLAWGAELALVDLHGVDGWTLIKELVEAEIPVVVISGAYDQELAEKASQMGVLDWLPKPFGADELAKLLERISGGS